MAAAAAGLLLLAHTLIPCSSWCAVVVVEPQVLLEQIEASKSKLTGDLAQAEAMIGEQAASIVSLQKQLVDTEEQLVKATKDVAEKDAKARIRLAFTGLGRFLSGAGRIWHSAMMNNCHALSHPLPLSCCSDQGHGGSDPPPPPAVQIKGMEEVMHHSQSYSSTLQSYNTTLQADLNSEKSKREEIGVLRDALQGQVAELSGRLKGAEERLQFDQVRAGGKSDLGGREEE